MAKEPHPRSSIEAVLGFILTIITVVYPMTWWLKVFLIFVLGGIIIDLIVRSPWTFKWSWLPRVIFSSIAILVLLVISWNPIKEQWRKDHPAKQAEQKQSAFQQQPTTEEIAKEIFKMKNQKPTLQPTENQYKKQLLPAQQVPQFTKDFPADVALRFVHPKSPALLIVNQSDSVARDIKWMVTLWNMDLPDRNDPLPIPVQTFDWIKGHDEGGPQNLFGSRLVSPLLTHGNRLFGSASVNCPTCTRGRTYIVYVVWGEGGWFSEVENIKSGRNIAPKNFSKVGRDAYFKTLESAIAMDKRLPIKED